MIFDVCVLIFFDIPAFNIFVVCIYICLDIYNLFLIMWGGGSKADPCAAAVCTWWSSADSGSQTPHSSSTKPVARGESSFATRQLISFPQQLEHNQTLFSPNRLVKHGCVMLHKRTNRSRRPSIQRFYLHTCKLYFNKNSCG